MSEIQKTLAERKSKYGDFRGHAELAVSLKEFMRSSNSWSDMEPYMQESLDMIQHKIARILNGDPTYDDSWVDIIGYAQLALDRIRQDKLTQEIEETFSRPAPEPGSIFYKTVGTVPQMREGEAVVNLITPNPPRETNSRDAW